MVRIADYGCGADGALLWRRQGRDGLAAAACEVGRSGVDDALVLAGAGVARGQKAKPKVRWKAPEGSPGWRFGLKP
jgi:hypothetical protein